MPVNSKHPLYSLHNDRVVKCRDVVEGSDVVKAKGVTYLPKLGGQSVSEYNGYKDRALFTNVTFRSLSGYIGVITSKEPKVEYPAGMEKYFEDATLTNTSFNELFRYIVEDVFISGRVPILVDRDTAGGRAYIVRYLSEQLINWMTDPIGNLTMANFSESEYEQDSRDPFKLDLVTRYRVLMMTQAGYVVRVYASEKSAVGDYTEIVPTIKGDPLTDVPLTIITPQGISAELYKPPMLDIAEVNLSHYRTSADLEHGRHWVSLPTPVVSGVDGDTTLRVGSQTAWVLPDKDAKAYYLEFVGQGLQSLEKALAEKHAQMTLFSAQLMNTSTRGSEASDVIKLRFAADAATLASITTAVEVGLNKVYKTMALWEGFNPDEVNITLDKEFINTSLTAAEIQALTKSYVDGAIDEETYIFNLKRGGLVPVDKERLESKPTTEVTNNGT